MTCRGWAQEAAMRMLMNNLDPAVAERPEDLVVYGGTGRAARSWEAFDAIVGELKVLRDDQTLLVQSGKPVGVFDTHEWAPRVLISNSMLVPEWATWEEFRRLEALGLTMYGQMTAGSWIYIGTQGILQGTYETFAAIARKRFGGSLAGTITLTAGLGGMGGAQPLAVALNGGVAICIEVDEQRIARRLEHGYLDVRADDLEHALKLAADAKKQRKALSIGLHGNAAEVLPALARREFDVDIVTDQTPAHDPLSYIPAGISPDDAQELRLDEPDTYIGRARESMARHVEAMVAEFSDDEPLVRWIKAAGERVHFQGLPARICWLGYGERARAGRRFNDLVRSGTVKAPIVIGRDHLDSGSVASPYRETESMRDGSDAIADWPILNALLNTSSGASWVSVHHGGGVGIGYSQHAGVVVVADGTENPRRRLERVLISDPGMGILRHADAG